ncbi:hypothetical protein C0W96_06590 [Photobacterium kishitanii]|uniref:hypothetical protein n=1 Tax=Photobacterium kishitanii TaxID=318456 RepID=UPI0005D35210|nr:hypothetical protein [Photobacterium kishitanii]KJG10177.1 hypothetical protein UB40_09025 [Photobacterium kishitanii]PSV06925.1 hypothetical protein C0W96_06590 [Photobacterium kishitanii]PSV78055.1 hypothetical protein C0W29_01645 [Photobacterium kishitanii]
MEISPLKHYPKLNSVLPPRYRNRIIDLIHRVNNLVDFGYIINAYSLYVVVTQDANRPFSPIKILNCEKSFQGHLEGFVGFVYVEFQSQKLASQYSLSKTILKTLAQLASDYGLTIQLPALSTYSISADVQRCIDLYNSLQKNESERTYYNGWSYRLRDTENGVTETMPLHLATIHDTYGENFCNLIAKRMSDYLFTLPNSSTPATTTYLISVLNALTRLFKTEAELREALSPKCSIRTMMDIFDLLLEQRVDGLDERNKNKKKKRTKPEIIKRLTIDWVKIVTAFTECFIKTGEFEKPNFPFILPKFKEPTKQKTISVGGDLPVEIEESIFGDIPMEIKDEQAINIIHDRINREILHVRTIAEQWLTDINARLDRVDEYRKVGQVKPYLGAKSVSRFNIGESYPENVVATFHHYGYNPPFHTSSYPPFLKMKTDNIINLCALPTFADLYTLCALLVIEHPKITPAWLDDWRLYDKSDTLDGVRKTGDLWVAVSLKNRRGVHLAQQEVILNDFSKKVVDTIIRLTSFARESLNKSGNSRYRSMLLISSLGSVRKPTKIGNSICDLVGRGTNAFNNALYTDSTDENGSPILTKEQSEKLAKSLHLRPLRSLRGLQVYLETKSVKAVADALGHKNPDMSLLESYLPKQIMNFFNDRWVRIFQNALIFEAMKDNSLLPKALDFDEKKLEEFLANHRLKDLPEHLKVINSDEAEKEEKEQLMQSDKIVFMISTGLLQMLIAISDIVENAMPDESIPEVVERWYKSAKFILSWLDADSGKEKSKKGSLNPELYDLYAQAKENPLCITSLKEQLC